jgi:CrcB protein
MVVIVSREIFLRKRILAVICGGFCGTLARTFLSLWIQSLVGKGWPYDILSINISGAFVLAFLTTLADASLLIGPTRRLFFNVGFLGAYTTFSSMALGSVTLIGDQRQFLALLYLLCSLIGGSLAVVLGQLCGIGFVDRMRHRQAPAVATASLAADLQREKAELLGREASIQSLQEEEKEF